MTPEEALEKAQNLARYKGHVNVIHTETVIACDSCKGVGFYYKEELTDYHRGDYRDIHHECKRCNGSGKLVKISDKISISDMEETKTVPWPENPLTKNVGDSGYVIMEFKSTK